MASLIKWVHPDVPTMISVCKKVNKQVKVKLVMYLIHVLVFFSSTQLSLYIMLWFYAMFFYWRQFKPKYIMYLVFKVTFFPLIFYCFSLLAFLYLFCSNVYIQTFKSNRHPFRNHCNLQTMHLLILTFKHTKTQQATCKNTACKHASCKNTTCKNTSW